MREENKRKHLEFIQNTISRMSGNLFFLRGWTVTLITAMFALFVKDANQRFIFVAYIPLLVFWMLDGYFLSQERLFRALYEHVRKLPQERIDFSMDTTKYRGHRGNSWLAAILSHTLLMFYLPFFVLLVGITYWLCKD